jgi:hypothetical protein
MAVTAASRAVIAASTALDTSKLSEGELTRLERKIANQIEDATAELKAERDETVANLAAAEEGKRRAIEAMASVALRLADAVQAQVDAEVQAEKLTSALRTIRESLHDAESNALLHDTIWTAGVKNWTLFDFIDDVLGIEGDEQSALARQD